MKFENKNEKSFLIFTCLLSAMQGIFYVIDGFKTGFTINDIIMIVMDFLYIPINLIWRRKGFYVYIFIMTSSLIFISAFQETYLFNNFSALLMLFIGMMIFPRHKKHMMIFYLFASAIAFAIDTENVYYYLIHASRAIWLYEIDDYVITESYDRKPLILTEDEKKILEQLCNNKMHKELELDGYSESTIKRRIQAAKERNGIQSTEELKDLYKKYFMSDK